MKNSNLDLIVGIGVFVAGIFGVGYAIGTRSKVNRLCEKLDTSIDNLSDDIQVDIPDKMVERQYTTISDGVTTEIATRVARIDEGKLRKEVVEKAKEQIADKFDDKLDDLLEEFNGNLQNVGKIYKSIAKSFSKED